MSIQSVSSPPDLKLWDPDKEGAKPFYFELFDETEPLLDGSFAELATAATTGGAPTAPRSEALVRACAEANRWMGIGVPIAAFTRLERLDIRGSERIDVLRDAGV